MIDAETLQFLSLVAKHNNREWFQANKARYETARENVLDFTSKVIARLSQLDSAIPNDLDPRECVMRIYRDIRFSLDKTPYKTNFGIGISANGKSFKGPGYYIHVHPSEPFAAGGCWMPDAPLLKSIRQEIDYNAAEFLDTIGTPDFRKYFNGVDKEHSLKLLPKGYPADHPQIDLLKLKSFTCTHSLQPIELQKSDSPLKVAEILGTLTPFMKFLRNAG